MSIPFAPLSAEPTADSTMEEARMKSKQLAKPAQDQQYRERRPRWTPLLQRIQPDAAGIDCGAEHHYVAVPPDRDAEPVRAFRTFTADLNQLADWLIQCRIKTVAMESTGVYWIPLFEILEARGIEVVLVNAHHLRNVRGRKSDVTDCEWLRELHSVGLLNASFRPAADIVVLRTYLRQRASLVEEASSHIQRMQKSLTQMNLMLYVVLSDITGATGLKIIRSILDGQRDPAALASHRDHRCKASAQEIAAALTGNYRAEHLFTLKQNFEAYQFDCQQIAQCDAAIQQLVDTLATQQPPPATELPSARHPFKPKRHDPSFDIRTPLHRLTGGADLSQIDGIGPHAALQLIAEIGTDMSRWPSAAHFTSWLSLAPNNKISGGRLLSSRTQPSANRAAAILRRCAMSLMRTSTALGAFYRRLAARSGKPTAITATARKLAILIYRVLCGDISYSDPGAEAYAQLHRTRLLKSLCKRAQQLGHALVDLSTGEILPPHGVS
jgi:transposase